MKPAERVAKLAALVELAVGSVRVAAVRVDVATPLIAATIAVGIAAG